MPSPSLALVQCSCNVQCPALISGLANARQQIWNVSAGTLSTCEGHSTSAHPSQCCISLLGYTFAQTPACVPRQARGGSCHGISAKAVSVGHIAKWSS